jgi:PadR family transcriptional regulator PadR
VRTDLVRGHLDGLLLAVLAEAPAHGYELIQRLAARSDGALDLPEGTIYPALHRLERAGLARSSWAREGGRRRRVYRLSAAGRRAAAEARGEWRAFATAVDRVLGATA